MMAFTPPQPLIYRGYDGFGGFRAGQQYELTVGQQDGLFCIVHPTSKEPWVIEPEYDFWKKWERVK